VDYTLAILFVRDVRVNVRRAPVRIANFQGHRFDFRSCPRRDYHGRAFPGKLQCHGAANPAPATGNDCYPFSQQHESLRNDWAG
jgi:hypothetical protein